ncbi:MAG: branched-chain amino acid ABC transporter permease [Deltaproteobacteria bacterium]|jgi:branched-chain amino acid transport system permease protein|nr:branched-chain amino acid ABC transporter permease [Deltaproteobacteria bacterium]MCW8893887.1 branched-chain amino acid ABC transporter permease [Deltaproteobacteria bacterium]MCW9050459.1 branched-chain amino acid ABC transporter permease [Deltaproteobacteria bacterium]
MLQDFKKSILVSIWFVFLTFPLMVVRVNTMDQVVIWRWMNLVWVAIGSFILSYLWRYMLSRKQARTKVAEEGGDTRTKLQLLLEDMNFRYKAMGVILVLILIFPLVFDTYQSTIMISALIYVVLGLGLNISVGLAGLLDLGYVAFFGVGAYTYALLNHHFDLGFWITLPIGGVLGCLLGVVLGFPILRLRGDYLAIVTLGFGMIFKVVMENWDALSFGPSGIANIDRPSFFGMDLSLANSTIYIYYIMIAMVIFTILITNRLKNSRIGRAWIALREDEIACVAMGIDMAKTKLSAYALGAFWAGMVGVLFASKTTFINPASFTFMESAIILSIVVLGGMGSILGVILGAFILILLPEYMRAFSEYRMLAFGAAMVLMMIFRPQGIISNLRQTYEYKGTKEKTDNG